MTPSSTSGCLEQSSAIHAPCPPRVDIHLKLVHAVVESNREGKTSIWDRETGQLCASVSYRTVSSDFYQTIAILSCSFAQLPVLLRTQAERGVQVEPRVY